MDELRMTEAQMDQIWKTEAKRLRDIEAEKAKEWRKVAKLIRSTQDDITEVIGAMLDLYGYDTKITITTGKGPEEVVIKVYLR